MIKRILLAVDDSAASLAAAHTAIEIAAATGATLHVLHVLVNDEIAAALRAASCTGVPMSTTAESLLAHVARLATDAGVPVHTEHTTGEPARRVFDHARSWPADLVVIGRTDHLGPGQPYIGHHTQHILEFAEWPVLIVPPATSSPEKAR
jgi:nucleotide-binding universal stress UspA family protein